MGLKSLHLLIESFLWWLMPFGGIYWTMFPSLSCNSPLTALSDFVYGPNSSFSFTQRYY